MYEIVDVTPDKQCCVCIMFYATCNISFSYITSFLAYVSSTTGSFVVTQANQPHDPNFQRGKAITTNFKKYLVNKQFRFESDSRTVFIYAITSVAQWVATRAINLVRGCELESILSDV